MVLLIGLRQQFSFRTVVLWIAFITNSVTPCAAAVRNVPPIASIEPSAPDQVTDFARHMVLDGNRLLVTATQGGFLFVPTDSRRSNWTQEEYIRLPFRGLGSSFGAPAALRNDVAIFGASGLGQVAQQSGAAHVFRRPSESDDYVRTQTIWPADSEIFDQFGTAAVLGDGYAFVGADNDSHNGKTSTGTVTLFRQQVGAGGAYEEVSKFAPADISPGDGFGDRLHLEENALAALTRYSGVYLYEKVAAGLDQWEQTARIQWNPNDGYRAMISP